MRPLPGPEDDQRYVPGHGSTVYAVRHHDLRLEYAPLTNRLTGKATLDVEALEDVAALEFDLAGNLRVSKVRVDGKPPAKFIQRGDRLVVKLRDRLRRGSAASVDIAYAGRPEPLAGLDGEAGWEELDEGVIVASQPHGAPSWFPCNDRPSDKATYRIAVTAPAPYVVAANGVLTGTKRTSGGATWVFEEPAPMATYLATIQIGHYAETVVEASIPLRVVHPPGLQGEVDVALGRQAEMIDCFVEAFGPYPFSAYTVVVTSDELEIPLEAQTLSIFGSNFLSTQWQAQRLIAHELAHQWFGNSVTLRHWPDIWLHEGFACYAEWIWSEASGGPSADTKARDHWPRVAAGSRDLVLADPGPDLMFDDRVYKRGALTLHALRLTAGDEVFFTILRAWTQRYRHGTAGTEEFVALVDDHVDFDAKAFLAPWLTDLAVPALPVR